MNEVRISQAVEAAARALHESVRDVDQFKWEAMTESWRQDMRAYVRPAVIAALTASDTFARATPARPQPARPRLHSSIR